MLNWFVALTKGPFALLVILGHDSYAEILVSRTDLVELAPSRPRNFSETYNLFDELRIPIVPSGLYSVPAEEHDAWKFLKFTLRCNLTWVCWLRGSV